MKKIRNFQGGEDMPGKIVLPDFSAKGEMAPEAQFFAVKQCKNKKACTIFLYRPNWYILYTCISQIALVLLLPKVVLKMQKSAQFD